MKKIVFENPDGTIGVIHPTGEIPVEEVLVKDVPQGSSNAQIVEDSDIPSSKEDREFWEIKNGKVQVNAQKKAAKEAEKQAKKSEKDAVLSKLNVTEEEFKKLLDLKR